MNTNEAQTLALRLMDLQQRFESYVILHEEELREIKSTLSEMRRDILHLSQSPEVQDHTQDRATKTPLSEDEQNTEAEDISALLTL